MIGFRNLAAHERRALQMPIVSTAPHRLGRPPDAVRTLSTSSYRLSRLLYNEAAAVKTRRPAREHVLRSRTERYYSRFLFSSPLARDDCALTAGRSCSAVC